MVKSGTKVLIIEHDRDIPMVLEMMLRDEGYQVETIIDEDSNVLGKIQETTPDIIVLDILPTDTERGPRLLDALRTDSTAKLIPVLAMSTEERLGDASLASYNVKAVIAKPFELTQFLGKIEETLGLPPLHANLPKEMPHQPEVIQQVERILTDHSRDIMLRWLTSMKLIEPWKSRPEMSVADLLDSVPLLIDALVAALHFEDPADFFNQHANAVQQITKHARDRRSQGLPLPAVRREYSLLRDEVWSTIGRYYKGSLQPSEVVTLQQALDGTFDRIISETILAYTESDTK
jgi:CheY-like chemotaxis protein